MVHSIHYPNEGNKTPDLMNEIVVNLHMHTRYSDGAGSHRDIVKAALKSGLDAVIVTDHNVLVSGFEGYYSGHGRRVLLLVGEEIHDRGRDPQKNHLLALGADRELAEFATDPQVLIHEVEKAGGLSILAHPFDPAAPAFNETDISWVDWSVENFDGYELWNALSELKLYVPTRLHGLVYAFFPSLVAHAPHKIAVERWDQMLLAGRRVTAIGGSDAHATPMRLGPLRRVIFPYEFHFHGVNTHVLIPGPLSGDAKLDKKMIYSSMKQSRCFIGYDLPAPTHGFRFTAQGREQSVSMGEEIPVRGGITLQIILPSSAQVRLIKDGAPVQSWKRQTACAFIATDPGVYRVEAWRTYRGQNRGWIFSNPIFLR